MTEQELAEMRELTDGLRQLKNRTENHAAMFMLLLECVQRISRHAPDPVNDALRTLLALTAFVQDNLEIGENSAK